MTSTFGGCCDHRATPENHPGSCPRFSLVKGRCSGPDFWDWAKLLPQYFDLASYFFSVRNAHLQFDCSTTKQQLWFRLHARVEANSGFTYAKIHKYNLPGDGHPNLWILFGWAEARCLNCCRARIGNEHGRACRTQPIAELNIKVWLGSRTSAVLMSNLIPD